MKYKLQLVSKIPSQPNLDLFSLSISTNESLGVSKPVAMTEKAGWKNETTTFFSWKYSLCSRSATR